MEAVRVNRRGSGGGIVVHLAAAERTLCGRKLAELDVVETIEVDALHALDGCGACRRVSDGWTPDIPGRRGDLSEIKITAESAPGRVRRTGPLSHGLRGRHGSRLR